MIDHPEQLEGRLITDENAYERFSTYRLARLDDASRAVILLYESGDPNDTRKRAYVLFDHIDEIIAKEYEVRLSKRVEFEPEDYQVRVLSNDAFLRYATG